MLQVILPDSNDDLLPQFFIIPTVAHPFYFLTRHPVTAGSHWHFDQNYFHSTSILTPGVLDEAKLHATFEPL